MMKIARAALVLVAMLTGAGIAIAADGPFAGPVKNCHPCRFSPGQGQPQFELTFVFAGRATTRS